jgi:predicted TPR repeat methyltransferase
MESSRQTAGRSHGPSAAERQWRQALRTAGYDVAPTTIPVHPSQLNRLQADKAAAERAYRAFVAAEPDNLMGLDGLAFLLQHRGALAEAVQVRRQRFTAEARSRGIPEDQVPAVAAFLAASLGDGPTPSAVPPAYVTTAFDEAAASYDEHLVERLIYRGPQLLYDAVLHVLGADPTGLNILDLGCGTGLAGRALRPIAKRLAGIDLSGQMLRHAHASGDYDALQQAEIIDFLRATDEQFDLVVAADVLNYFGDLSPVFGGVAARLRPDGLFAMTVEMGESRPVRLRGPLRRFQHSQTHLREASAGAGVQERLLDAVVLRHEKGEPVHAWRGVWQLA